MQNQREVIVYRIMQATGLQLSQAFRLAESTNFDIELAVQLHLQQNGQINHIQQAVPLRRPIPVNRRNRQQEGWLQMFARWLGAFKISIYQWLRGISQGGQEFIFNIPNTLKTKIPFIKGNLQQACQIANFKNKPLLVLFVEPDQLSEIHWFFVSNKISSYLSLNQVRGIELQSPSVSFYDCSILPMRLKRSVNLRQQTEDSFIQIMIQQNVQLMIRIKDHTKRLQKLRSIQKAIQVQTDNLTRIRQDNQYIKQIEQIRNQQENKQKNLAREKNRIQQLSKLKNSIPNCQAVSDRIQIYFRDTLGKTSKKYFSKSMPIQILFDYVKSQQSFVFENQQRQFQLLALHPNRELSNYRTKSICNVLGQQTQFQKLFIRQL